MLCVPFIYLVNDLVCIGAQVERLQGIINKLTAENVEYRDNNKTQQFEVRIQELQQILKQTGEFLSLLLTGAMNILCMRFVAGATQPYASGMPDADLQLCQVPSHLSKSLLWKKLLLTAL